MDKKMIDKELDRLMSEVGEDDDDLERGSDPGDRVGVTIPVTDPTTERIRAPMSMPYDAGDARSAADPGHKAEAMTAYILKGAAEMGATVDEVKEAFPELAPAIDEAVARAKQNQA